MKAARTYGIRDVRIEEMDIPEPKPNEVQLRVKYTGICGSDVHGYFRGWALPTLPHPLTGKVLPVVTGHEISGEVVKLGAAVKNLAVGDRVCVDPLLHCDECEACLKGFRNCCENAVGEDGSGNIVGFGSDGGFAEFVNVNAVDTYRIPDDMDYKLGALIEPAAVAVEAIQKSRLKTGQDVLVMGAGPIGLLIAITATLAGARVIIADVAKERLERAQDIGIKYVLDSSKTDVAQEVRSITGNGVDIAYDVAGVQATFNLCTKSVKNKGKIMVVAVFNDPPRVDFAGLLMRGVDILTTLCYANVYEEAIKLVDGNRWMYEKVISKVIELDDLVEQGFEACEKDKTQSKILVRV